MNKNAIILANASYKYTKKLEPLYYEDIILEAGKVTLITGPNGSGKTTLLKLCTGILRADSGELSVFGERANDWSLGKMGQCIGYLFQEPSRQLFCSSVWDEMTFASAMRGEKTEIIQQKALKLLEKFGLKPLMRRSVYSLSRGEKQRLAIATILMNDLQFLMLDEPTTGLDRENRAILYKIIEELISEEIGVVIVTHDREVLEKFQDANHINLTFGGQRT